MRLGEGGATKEKLRSGRLAAAGAFGLLLLDYPLLSLVDHPVRILGVPLLWAYLFVLWAALIALIAYIVREVD